MTPPVTRISENLARVRQNIAEAARVSGREPEAVKLVAVTKYVGVEEIRALVEAGCQQLGESRPQQLWQRVPALDDRSVHWHLIGHLQRNKVERTLPLVDMIHSVDSLRLATTIDESAARLGRKIPVLLEVNISGEEAKHGLQPAEMEPLLVELSSLARLEIRGLMGMASLEGGLDVARRDFARLRQLRDQLRCHCPPGVGLDELSMGMSGDYEVAIEEGATIVRVGSALFEGLLP